MEELSLEILLFLLAASTFAGFIDSIAGGGGLIQLPALLVGMSGTAPATLLGTNKVPSFIGTSFATASYLRKIRPDFRLAFVMAIPAFIGSALGAGVATAIPKDAFRPIILFLLVTVFLYTWRRKELGLENRPKYSGNSRYIGGAIFGFTIGFYDGIFGPGTGSFLMLSLVGILGFTFLQASVTAKLVNLATNVGAIVVFGLNAQIIWSLGLIMAIGNVSGALIGAKWAMRGGSELVRRVFLFVTLALITRLFFDTFF